MKKKINYLIMILSVSLLAYACSDNSSDNIEIIDPTKNIVETAQETEALENLVAALIKADESDASNLIGALSGDGPFTVFAPTNEAFGKLLEALDGYSSLEDFDSEEDKMVLATILKYHVISGVSAKSTDLSDAQELVTVQEEKLTIKLNSDIVYVSDATTEDARVIIPDVETSNGIVHVIDKVLLPQAIIDAINQEEIGTLVDIVVETEALSILEAAVIKADLVETLSSEGPFTVFAPTDDAFVALLDVLGDDYNGLDDFDTEAEMALLKDILLYHVIAGAKVMSGELSAGSVDTALSGNTIDVITSGDTYVLGDASDVNANITGFDIMASNGIAHTIDKVLLPQSAIDFVASLSSKNLVEIVVETEALSILEAAVIKAGLVETLSSEGPFTVFAPTDDAFVALLDVLGDDYNGLDDFDTEAEMALLKDILLYHVISGAKVLSTDLSEGMVATALADNSIGIVPSGDTYVLGDASDVNANITGFDIMASNGVAHTIDKVLLPQSAIDFVTSLSSKNIVELAVGTEILSSLVAALQQADAGLVEILSEEGPFTVFAPTNEAFENLLDDLGHDYNSLEDFDTDEEKAMLANILKYHVLVGAKVFSDELSDGQCLTMAQHGTVTILLDHDVFATDELHNRAKVIAPDQEANNGIVHVVDRVLLPKH